VPHRDLILEDCIACDTPAPIARPPASCSTHSARSYIADDELVEVTPKIVRLRKKKLDPTERKKLVRQAA
jgi:predicted membrane GTPase involved in stress response